MLISRPLNKEDILHIYNDEHKGYNAKGNKSEKRKSGLFGFKKANKTMNFKKKHGLNVLNSAQIYFLIKRED